MYSLYSQIITLIYMLFSIYLNERFHREKCFVSSRWNIFSMFGSLCDLHSLLLAQNMILYCNLPCAPVAIAVRVIL
jgi:hypothetical protein